MIRYKRCDDYSGRRRFSAVSADLPNPPHASSHSAFVRKRLSFPSQPPYQKCAQFWLFRSQYHLDSQLEHTLPMSFSSKHRAEMHRRENMHLNLTLVPNMFTFKMVKSNNIILNCTCQEMKSKNDLWQKNTTVCSKQ